MYQGHAVESGDDPERLFVVYAHHREQPMTKTPGTVELCLSGGTGSGTIDPLFEVYVAGRSRRLQGLPFSCRCGRKRHQKCNRVLVVQLRTEASDLTQGLPLGMPAPATANVQNVLCVRMASPIEADDVV